jgi:hypothetical protein
MELQYFFAKPRCPIICIIINDNLAAARSKSTFEKKTAKYELKEKSYQTIDAAEMGWLLHIDQLVVFPEFSLKN